MTTAVALAALVALATVGFGGVTASDETPENGWSRVAAMHNRQPGSSFSDERLEEARDRLAEAVREATGSDEGNRSGNAPVMFPGNLGGDGCSVDCGEGCGSCSASASCDEPACSCSCSCQSEGTCQDCGWCGCSYCPKTRDDYQCSASCSGVGVSVTIVENVTLDGEADFTADQFRAWTEAEDGNASLLRDAIVTVAAKDLAGRDVAGTPLEPALSTWADLLLEYHAWSTADGPQKH
jgi:hypothetical protein